MFPIVDDLLNPFSLFCMKKAGKTEKAQTPNFRGDVNPNKVSFTDPIKDTFGFSKEYSEEMFKDLTTAFLLGFCCSTCPSLLVFAVGAFLFANQAHDSFRDKVTENIQKSDDAMTKLAKKVNEQHKNNPVQPEQKALPYYPEQKEEVKALPYYPEQKAEIKALPYYGPESNEIKTGKTEEKELTPLQKAEVLYQEAEQRVTDKENDWAQKSERAEIANQKLENAKIRLENARIAYENAQDDVLAAAERRFNRANTVYEKRNEAAHNADKEAEIASLKLQEAENQLYAARDYWAILQAEEIVDTTPVIF